MGRTSRIARSRPGRSCLAVALALILPGAPTTWAQEGTLVRKTIHGHSLEKSVTGESPDRQVSIYVPPGYDASPDKRYPTLYLLHGFADTDETWTAGKGPWSNL